MSQSMMIHVSPNSFAMPSPTGMGSSVPLLPLRGVMGGSPLHAEVTTGCHYSGKLVDFRKTGEEAIVPLLLNEQALDEWAESLAPYPGSKLS
jgi:hypothetical protein